MNGQDPKITRLTHHCSLSLDAKQETPSTVVVLSGLGSTPASAVYQKYDLGRLFNRLCLNFLIF